MSHWEPKGKRETTIKLQSIIVNVFVSTDKKGVATVVEIFVLLNTRKSSVITTHKTPHTQRSVL